jgi:hypothetical protein
LGWIDEDALGSGEDMRSNGRQLRYDLPFFEGVHLNVFLSWSGPVGRLVAQAWFEWLPRVLQAAKPWLSDETIPKGSQWFSEIHRNLRAADVGIACLTRDSLSAPWLLYEAGVLSRGNDLFTFLFELKPADVAWPLAQFQHTTETFEDVTKLVGTINERMISPLSDQRLKQTVEVHWPIFQTLLAEIHDGLPQPNNQPVRSDRELLEELLALARRETIYLPPWLRDQHYYQLILELKDLPMLGRVMEALLNAQDVSAIGPMHTEGSGALAVIVRVRGKEFSYEQQSRLVELTRQFGVHWGNWTPIGMLWS